MRVGDVPPGGDPPTPPPQVSASEAAPTPAPTDPAVSTWLLPAVLGYAGALTVGALIGFVAQGARPGAATGALAASAVWASAETVGQLRAGRTVFGLTLLALGGASAVLAVRRKPGGGWRR